MSTLEKFFANLPDCGCRESGGAEISATTSDDPFFAKLDRLLAAVPNTSVIPSEKPDQPADDAVAARVREIFSDEKVERELYVEAIAKGLETPYVMFDQPDANKPLLAGNWRITVNVPSVIPDAAVAATFDAATAREYAIEAFRRDPKLTDTFLSFLRTQLPAEAWWELERTADIFVPLLQQHPEYSLETVRRMTRDTLRRGRKSGGGIEEETEPKPSYTPDKWPCGVEYPQTRNPSWYLGFVRSSFMRLTAKSNYDAPTGKVFFGNRGQVSFTIPLPGRWPSPSGGTPDRKSEFTYHFAIRIFDGENESDLDNAEEMSEIIRLLGPIIFTMFLYYQYPTDDSSGESPGFQGVLLIYNADSWMCQLESLDRYKPHDSVPNDPSDNWDEWKGYNTNLFDDIAIEADRRFDFHDVNQPILISWIRIDNNAVTVLNNSFLLPLNPRGSQDRKRLGISLRNFKSALIEPANGYFDNSLDPFFTARNMVDLARESPIIAQATRELGQAWSQKYGGTWYYEKEAPPGPGWLPGPYNWCSESSMWFIREANRLDEFIDLSDHESFYRGTDISLHQWIRWFLCKGRYISGKTAGWKDLGRLVRSGHWVSVKDKSHAVLFLYWTRPPHIEFPLSPARRRRGFIKPANDPLNEREEHVAWDSEAADFDPDAKVNRFRCIAGNQGSRVRIANYSIVRVANQKELDAWRYMLLATHLRYDPRTGKIVDVTYEDIGNKEEHDFLFWREGDNFWDGDEEFCQETVQDGFGQTYGDPYFVKNLFACEELGA